MSCGEHENGERSALIGPPRRDGRSQDLRWSWDPPWIVSVVVSRGIREVLEENRVTTKPLILNKSK